MFEIIKVTSLDKSVTSIFLIALILFVRKNLNIKSIRYANMVLWTIFFAYLLIPYNLQINLSKDYFAHPKGYLFELAEIAGYYSNIFIKAVGSILYKNNRQIVTMFLILYILIQIVKTAKVVGTSKVISNNQVMIEYLKIFNLKRKVQIMVNDNLKVPITYGIIRPKIILQSHILEDYILLKYVLIHELIHIRKFDIVLNHLKYFVVCIYWYNPLIFAVCKYIEDDLEILCDKLVLKTVGETKEHKKEYLESMIKLIENEDELKRKLPLKLNPTLKRMNIMKKYKLSVAGVMSLALVSLISITSFANVEIDRENTTVSSVAPVKNIEIYEFNENNRTTEITEEEYNSLNIHVNPQIGLRSMDVSDTQRLDGYEVKKYSFDMSSNNTGYHDGFTTKISNVYCADGANFEVIIQENTREIYRGTFDREVTLKTEAKRNDKYYVIVRNNKSSDLKFDIDIKSYIR